MRARVQRSVIGNGRTEWAHARLAGLEAAGDASLGLARIPGPGRTTTVTRPGPYDPPLQGFTVSPRGEIVFASDGDPYLVLVDTNCADARAALSRGREDSPLTIGGLAADRDLVWVADESGARVLALTLPG